MAHWGFRESGGRWPHQFYIKDATRLSYAARCAAHRAAVHWCRAENGHEDSAFARWGAYDFDIYFLDDDAALAFKLRWG